MAYKPNDYYAQKARRESYAARSVYKLQELDRRFKIFKPAQRVLDLGASPGSWSQYAVSRISHNGLVVGVDLKKMAVSLPNAVFFQTGIEALGRSLPGWAEAAGNGFNVVISDMAPATTGNKLADQAASYALCLLAFETACEYLRPGGHFVCKMFESDETPGFREALKQRFSDVHLNRPKGTQKGSTELFLVGLGFSR